MQDLRGIVANARQNGQGKMQRNKRKARRQNSSKILQACELPEEALISR
jgi:hypothetical protein